MAQPVAKCETSTTPAEPKVKASNEVGTGSPARVGFG